MKKSSSPRLVFDGSFFLSVPLHQRWRGESVRRWRVRMRWILFVFWFFSLGFSAHASYISLPTTLSSKVEGRTLKIMVSSINKGDESAYNIQAELRVGGKEILAEKRTELPVNSSYQAQATILIPTTKPGTYPLILTMHYTDANQYPFSALTAQTYIFRKESVSPIFGQVKSASFSKEGNLGFKLKNLGDREIKAKTYLIAPRELTVEKNQLELIVGPKSEKNGSFTIKNFSALSGSTYQVFAVSEFEDGNMHYSTVSPGTIKIIEAKTLFGLDQNILLIILSSLVAVFIFAQFYKWKR